MPKAADVKRGNLVEINGQYMLVQQIDISSPTARGAKTLYRMRFNKLPAGGKFEQTFTGDEMIKDAALERRKVSFLYQEGDFYTFMDSEDYSQYMLNSVAIEAQLPFLMDGLDDIMALLVDGEILAVELPSTVIMEIVETVPGMKAASATGRTKPARFATGLELQVPEYLEAGEKVKINTETGKFLSRA
ncbi:elongation factor P-like protein EfpL [Marinobacterium weihaiense]|uniref:Elongation factor P-like protein n=1 Tax=Marinobacterium weihaiense TaxID=2851016 RepID=A0ABS6M760_9GAMM|nr:elongation factor P-like protein YeiP [Marinobacterium weihaiense]MBV0932118.1 elongation factor P-like protein YeiP [Marinobacterium weihaiense]